MLPCPCDSKKNYVDCCEPLLEYKAAAQTPEELMRSRYTAYCLAKMDYIQRTMKISPLSSFNAAEAKQLASRVDWIGLTVLQSYMETAKVGFVEFEARMIERNKLKIMHELSEFHQEGSTWIYVDGLQKQGAVQHKTHPIARNNPCPCGSGKKFKNCHER